MNPIKIIFFILIRRYEILSQAKKEDLEVRLYELYYSYVLALEIERLLKDADDKINQIENSLDDSQENGDDIDESDIYKELKQFGMEVDILDPHANKNEVKDQYQISIKDQLETKYDAIILAVSHNEFLKIV